MPENDKQAQHALYDAVRRITRRVGHDLRNPLGMIAQAVYILKMQIADGDPAASSTADIIDTAVRDAEARVNRLNDFVVYASPDLALYHVQDVIETAIARACLADNISVTLHSDPDIPLMNVDGDQLLVAFRTLLAYCADAMPQGGDINISLAIADQELEVRIHHTGQALTSSALDSLVDPFSTDLIYGTGLEIPLAILLVEFSGGSLHTDNGQIWLVNLPMPDQRD